MAHYVKFMRGTPEAYNNLAQKDNDTLYFISSKDSADGLLYLGSKLISGDNDGLTTFSLSQLEDVMISENLSEKSLLIYKDGHWVDVKPADLVFIGATNSSNGIAGFVPAPEKEQTNLFLRSDGTWAEISVNNNIVADVNVITIENEDDTSLHADLINAAIQQLDLEIAKGDIVIVKDLIVSGKWQYTSYVYDGEHWTAMDGNYNAENVYFDEDFVFTEKIGTVKTLTNGSATVAAAGKNVKEFLASLFAAESQPTISKPSYSLTVTPILADTAEVGNYINGYSWDGTWSAGSYQYGSKQNSGTTTGITPSYEVNENKESKNATTIDGSFTLDAPIQIDSINAKTYATITGKCTYGDSPYTPVTNLGNPASAGAITGNTITKTADVSVTGYRSSFKYVGEDCTSEINSDFIRAAVNMNGNTKDFGTVVIPQGTKRVMFAVPGTTATLKSVTDIDGMGLPVTDNFTKHTIAVEGANGFAATDYTVFVQNKDEGLAATRFAVVIS